ncbi:MAG: asparagine synthase-related protein, partial [Ilumatobacteraceae bacterium]
MAVLGDPHPFAADALDVDPAALVAAVGRAVEDQVVRQLRKRGVVVGLSGGVDSSVVAALCVEALGRERVFGLFMPERDSASDSLELGRRQAALLGIDTCLEPIGDTLEAIGCYRRQDEAIRTVFPAYGPGYKSKITMPSVVD